MAEIRPFRALRPIPELICKIAELPYDVMNQKRSPGHASPKSLELFASDPFRCGFAGIYCGG